MMSQRSHGRRSIVWGSALAMVAWLAASTAAWAGDTRLAQAANPCAQSSPNPCNPRAGANPCGAGANPCGSGAIDAARFVQPAGVSVATSDALLARGEALWNDPALGKTGLACGTCHAHRYAQMNASFAEPFPHRVAMPAARAGVAQAGAAEMVNFCMLVPMGSEPLAWDSQELAALTSYVEHIQPGYREFLGQEGANPCNPCGGSNPCAGANPCNPCSP